VASRGPFLPGVVDPRLIGAYRKAQRFLRRKYVTGLSIGRPRRRGLVPEHLAICIHVSAKVPADQLAKGQLFPREIDGVPVDVIASQVRAQVGMNPIVPGAQVMRSDGFTGTVGLIVRAANGTPCVLTAAHVLNALGQPAYQPSVGAGNAIGPTSQPTINAWVDAAIAPTAPRGGMNRPIGAATEIGSFRYVAPGETLAMSGAASGLRRALANVGQHVVVYPNGSSLLMHGVLLGPLPGDVALLSRGGDSGAAWFDSTTGAAVGLHVAGGPDGTDHGNWAFACHMPEVFKALGLRIL
jgi:hypothetical protein